MAKPALAIPVGIVECLARAHVLWPAAVLVSECVLDNGRIISPTGMNQNDMDRYFWRTGRRWSGDDRLRYGRTVGRRISKKMILLLLVAFIGTSVYLLH